MTAIVIFFGLLALCVLAAVRGVDSRVDRPGRQL
jgi:multisubunit Na+/H+ antiporter MnhC subunit